MTTLHRFGGFSLKTLTFVTGLAVAVGLVTGIAIFGVNRTTAASCTSNDIMKCGFTTPSDFIAKVKANDNGVNGTADLQAIYAHYGLSSADYGNFAAHAVQGEAMRDGRIVVNSKVVGTGGMSIGRLESFQGSNPFSVSIAGHMYFGNVNSQAFAAGVNEIPVYVLLDSNGGFKFAVMPACGNPEFPESKPAPQVKATAVCQVLNKTADPTQANTFDFTAAAVKTGSAQITKFVYDFGDGSPTVTETDGSTPVPHTYTKSGTFTASVTVFANLPGQPNAQLPAVVMCTKQVTVAITPPPTPQVVVPTCKLLTATPSLDNKMAFSFLVTAVPNGSTFTSADFNFGDGNTQNSVTPNGDGVTASATHTYSAAGTFTASAVLHFTDPNGRPVTAPQCTAVPSPIAPPPPPAPEALPNTGAGDTIGIFLGTVSAGTLGYRMLVRRRLNGR